MKEALFYKKEPLLRVRCVLCPHRCQLANGKTGLCGVRVNESGVLYSTVYEKVAAYGLDPMEKKPLYHFYPGSSVFTYATQGCTFRCTFCSNHQLSQGEPNSVDLSVAEIISLAQEAKAIGVAASYSEPVDFYEFAQDTAMAARQQGLKSVVVTNGYILEEPLKQWLPHFDAVKVDLKGGEVLYREVSGGQILPVLRTMRLTYENKVHLEVSTPLIPTLNDYDEDFEALARMVAEISPRIPFHILAYHPAHKVSLEPTSLDALKKAYDLARKHLRFVYVGNMAGVPEMQTTYCPECHGALIKREGQHVTENLLKEGKCPECSAEIPGVFQAQEAGLEDASADSTAF